MDTINVITSAKRIAIIGNAGSGKSTLAQKLHEILGLPLYHLDQYYWGANGERPDPAAYKKIHDELCDRESWIMDGVNLRVIEYRIARADVVIFLDIPTRICLWRVIKRSVGYYFQKNPRNTNGCSQKFDWNFLVLLHWMFGFKKKYIPKLTELFEKYNNTKMIYVLRSSQDIDHCISQLQK